MYKFLVKIKILKEIMDKDNYKYTVLEKFNPLTFPFLVIYTFLLLPFMCLFTDGCLQEGYVYVWNEIKKMFKY